MTATDAQDRGAPAKLPVWQTVTDAYMAFFDNFIPLIKGSWIWLLILGSSTAGLMWAMAPMQAAWMEAAQGAVTSGQPVPSLPWYAHALSILQNLLFLLGGSIIAVSWHRLLLRGEQPGLHSALPKAPAWRYSFLILLIFIVAFLPVVPVWLAMVWPMRDTIFTGQLPQQGAPIPLPMLVFVPLMLAAVFGFFLVFARLSVILPARAIGENGLNFRSIWKATRGNSWRLLFGHFICLLLPGLLLQLILWSFLMPNLPKFEQKFDMADWTSKLAVPTAIMTVLGTLAAMISIGFLSFAYRHFFERPQSQ
jgi:hypothetical protein